VEVFAVARIFYGRRDMLNSAVLEAVRTLSDDFWVLAEFDLDRRNIDWLIIRAVPDDRSEERFSTVWLTELKETSAQLSGGDYGRWTAERNGIAEEIVPANMADENYWRQTVNTVNVLRSWLYNNQRRFLALDQPEYAEAAIKAWPTLLILSKPADLLHRLPIAPANRFGAFHYDLPTWLDLLQRWDANQGLRLTADELGRLVTVLGLHELPKPAKTKKQATTAAQGREDFGLLGAFAPCRSTLGKYRGQSTAKNYRCRQSCCEVEKRGHRGRCGCDGVEQEGCKGTGYCHFVQQRIRWTSVDRGRAGLYRRGAHEAEAKQQVANDVLPVHRNE
jgi:hypothetical protein